MSSVEKQVIQMSHAMHLLQFFYFFQIEIMIDHLIRGLRFCGNVWCSNVWQKKKKAFLIVRIQCALHTHTVAVTYKYVWAHIFSGV